MIQKFLKHLYSTKERKINIILEDDFGRVQTIVETDLSAPQLMDKILESLEND